MCAIATWYGENDISDLSEMSQSVSIGFLKPKLCSFDISDLIIY